MVSKTDERAKEMAEFLLPRLLAPNGKFDYVTNEKLIRGEKIHYLRNNETKNLILLFNKQYSKKQTELLFEIAKSVGMKAVPLFYKDGETYFRSAAAGQEKTGLNSKTYKLSEDKSLKKYSTKDLQKIIQLSLPEINEIKKGPLITYYQPESDNLREKIKKYKFSPVIYDYTHIPKDDRFGPITTKSKTLYLITGEQDLGDKISGNLQRID